MATPFHLTLPRAEVPYWREAQTLIHRRSHRAWVQGRGQFRSCLYSAPRERRAVAPPPRTRYDRDAVNANEAIVQRRHRRPHATTVDLAHPQAETRIIQEARARPRKALP